MNRFFGNLFLGSFLLITVSIATASADQREMFIERNDVSLSLLTEGELLRVVSTVPRIFPPQPERTPMSHAEVKFTLNGCLDRLGPVTSFVHNNSDGSVEVLISAINIANKDSFRVRCTRLPTGKVKIFLGPGFINQENVQLKFASFLDN